jgi:hypothetical protein
MLALVGSPNIVVSQESKIYLLRCGAILVLAVFVLETEFVHGDALSFSKHLFSKFRVSVNTVCHCRLEDHDGHASLKLCHSTKLFV